jgi:RNA polymerase sigma-70 factor (ECF subfamily)
MRDPETAEATRLAQAQLLERVAAGDLQAVAELYDQIATPLFSVALRILGDASEAEEVLQDVFVQIWEKASSFNASLGSAFHWALSITRHRSIDRLRSRQRRARLVEELQNDMPTGDSSSTGSGLEADDADRVRTALQSLPADQRQAIELAFFGGKTHLEIAELLNEPLGTVKARIRRGMLKLRESLQEYA